MGQPRRSTGEDPTARWALVAAGALLALVVLAQATTTPPYELVLGSLILAAALIAVHGWQTGPDVNPFAGPIALKLAILATTVLLQPSLVGRDPHFELAVTERILDWQTWDPGLGFASQKANGYAHYPGLSFVTASLGLLSGVETQALARLVGPALALLGLVLLVAISRQITEDDRLALATGLAWACFSLTNVFQAEYVHEALGFPFFLAGVYLLFRYADTGARVPLALFALVGAALVFTHHLSTAFLLGFLVLFALIHLPLTSTLRDASLGSGARRALVPVGLFAVFTFVYNTVLGDPAVFGYVESIWDTVADPVRSSPSTPSQPTAPNPDHPLGPAPDPDPNVQQAVVYERRGRDQAIFYTRMMFIVALVAASLANLAWRALHGRLDTRPASLLAWSGLILGLGLVVYVVNVTVGVDAPRLLPWAFAFLVVTAADVPPRQRLVDGLRERVSGWRAGLHRLADRVPTARTQSIVAIGLLVAFGAFQLVTLPPHLVSEAEDPAYYRSEVRQYYHADEQAMAGWIDTEIDTKTPILADMTTYELVGPTDHGELTITAPYVYSGDRQPIDESYVVWRDEMTHLYLGLDQSLETVYFPVPEDQRRTFQASEDYARLYASDRTGVYAYAG